MSAKVEAIIEIRDERILKDTLKKMGFGFTESASCVSIKRNYHNIEFHLNTNKVTFDDMNLREVNGIKIQYAKNLEIERLNALGATYEIVETEQNIEIYVN